MGHLAPRSGVMPRAIGALEYYRESCAHVFVVASNVMVLLLSGDGSNSGVSALSVLASVGPVRFWFCAFSRAAKSVRA